jgi:hypothetical protein
MKNSIKLFPIIVGLTVTGIISLCIGVALSMGNITNRDNTQVTKEFTVSDFTEVQFNGINDVVIIQSDTEKLVATGRKSLVESIEATVSNGFLKVQQEDTRIELFSFGYNNKAISYTLYVKNLSSIENRGVGSMSSDLLVADKLSITNDGVGEITLRGLKVKELTSLIKGTGSISVSGTADTLSTRVEGTGTFEGFSLISNSCVAVLKGIGSIEVSCKDSLDASLEGMGDISYEGDPKVTQQVKGLGEISKR